MPLLPSPLVLATLTEATERRLLSGTQPAILELPPAKAGLAPETGQGQKGWLRRLTLSLSGTRKSWKSLGTPRGKELEQQAAELMSQGEQAPIGNGVDGGQVNGGSTEVDLRSTWKEALKRITAEVASLEKPDPFSHRSGFDEAFDKLRRTSLHHTASSRAMEAAFLGSNEPKNRYCDVLPYDKTRVLLQGPGRTAPDSSDYINASHVQAGTTAQRALQATPGLVLPKYIATQGPLESTVGDFWEMTQQEQCAAVIMLCKEIECGKSKCAHYFPLKAGCSETFQHIRVTTLDSGFLDASRSVIKRTLRIEDRRGEQGGKSSTVSHFQYADWPDHGVPDRTGPIRNLLRCLRDSQLSAGPFAIHCSAGIGRTGTYCCVDFTLRRVLAGDLTALDIPATILEMRQQRAGMVQTRDQFRFCYTAVLEELRELVK